MGFGQSRRGSASGVFVGMVIVMVAATGITGAVFYYTLSNSSIGESPPSDGGQSGALSNSTLANDTATLGGQVRVTGSSLPAADFTATGFTTTFTCSQYPSEAYVALTNNGTGSASVTSLSITSDVNATTFTPSGACDIGSADSGAGQIYIAFPDTSEVITSPLQGSFYAGAVTFSDGSQIAFEGTWQ